MASVHSADTPQEGVPDDIPEKVGTSLVEVKVLETETSIPSEDENTAPLSTISTGAIFPPSMIPGTSSGDATGPAKKDFETISLEEQRKPRRIIHFSDGVVEEYSTDEDDEGEEDMLMQPVVDPKTMDWIPYIWHYVVTASFTTYKACDYLGEKLAYFFGITSPKYAYALNEYNRLEKEEKEELERQISEREEHRDRVARQTAERAFVESTQNRPEPGLPTSTH